MLYPSLEDKLKEIFILHGHHLIVLGCISSNNNTFLELYPIINFLQSIPCLFILRVTLEILIAI